VDKLVARVQHQPTAVLIVFVSGQTGVKEMESQLTTLSFAYLVAVLQ
jgi:hypothetical protein